MSRLNVRIPGELLEELKKISDRQRQTISEVVRGSLRKYIASEKLRQIRERTRSRAQARGFLTDEDIFATVS